MQLQRHVSEIRSARNRLIEAKDTPLITAEEERYKGDMCWLTLRNSEGQIEYWKDFDKWASQE